MGDEGGVHSSGRGALKKGGGVGLKDLGPPAECVTPIPYPAGTTCPHDGIAKHLPLTPVLVFLYIGRTETLPPGSVPSHSTRLHLYRRDSWCLFYG